MRTERQVHFKGVDRVRIALDGADPLLLITTASAVRFVEVNVHHTTPEKRNSKSKYNVDQTNGINKMIYLIPQGSSAAATKTSLAIAWRMPAGSKISLGAFCCCPFDER